MMSTNQKEKETDTVANAESIWNQINKNSVCKESNNPEERAKNSMQAMTCRLIST